MITLRVEFHGTFFCLAGSFAVQVPKWIAGFGPGFAPGLVTLQRGEPLLDAHGTLYVEAPDNVTPDTYGFLARNWSRDCIVVDTITPTGAAPDAATEQATVDAAHPAALANAGNWFGNLLAIIEKDAVTIIVVVAALIVVVELHPWGKR